MKPKICVYAIAKNEIKFIDRWFNSVKEADYICVLDTGSTDGSFEKFKSLGIIAEQKIYKQFRFDEARNDSLKLIPSDTDICVCIDIDEFFEIGWSKILCKNWNTTIGRVRYRYTWNFNPDGSEGYVFMADKIHKYNEYVWSHPVHEILIPKNSNKLKTIDLPNIQLNHMADPKKSRSNYLPLLELSIKEHPEDDRNTHYLAREYMFNGMYHKAIKTFLKHLSLPSATWKAERSASLRYISQCYKMLAIKNKSNNKNCLKFEKNNKNLLKISKKTQKNGYFFKKQLYFLNLAILEYPNSREAYYELAVNYFEVGDYLNSAIWFCQMLKISSRELNYISSPICWCASPYDYLSICYHYLGDDKTAFIYANKALSFGKNARIENNLKIFAEEFNKSQSQSQ